jgi:hypothetical protein
MTRHRNTDSNGKPFKASVIQAVWQKAEVSKEFPPLRVDRFGGLMFEHGYGSTGSKFGWEIDHSRAVDQGGGDDLQNLQPLQWSNNLIKADT